MATNRCSQAEFATSAAPANTATGVDGSVKSPFRDVGTEHVFGIHLKEAPQETGRK